MTIRIFPKPDLSPTKQKENLEYEINRLQIRLESLEGEYADKLANLTNRFQIKENDILRHTEDLERILTIKRAERKELEKPLDTIKNDLAKRELTIIGQEKSLEVKNQGLLEREKNAEMRENTLENFVDDLGERKMTIDKREKLIEQKEQILKQKENEYLLKIEIQNELYKQKDKEYQEKFNEVESIRIQTEATKENLEEREVILAKEKRLLRDRQDLLLRNLKRNATN